MKKILCIAVCLITFAALAQEGGKSQVPISREQISLSYAPIVKMVAPAVVNIYTKRVVTQQVHPFMNDPFFAHFFGHQGGATRQRVQNSLGSGVIISPDGVVITNSHVVDGAAEIIVGLADGREFSGQLSLTDERSDLAVIRITDDANDLPFAPLRPSESLEVGDLVLAIGNPFGVGQTVTSGIVSALARSAVNINDYNFFIQTDAAINPGNSGGALVAMDGGVVGINTAIFSRDGGSLGIGFAIPSEMVNTVLAAEKESHQNGEATHKGVVRPWLGAAFQTVTADLAESLNLDKPGGALITAIHSASPLQAAGLKIGDVITAVNGKRIRDPSELKFRMATVAIGNTADFSVIDGHSERNIKVTAIVPPEEPPRNRTTLQGKHPLDGIEVSNINPAVGVELGIDAESGVVVSGVTDQNRAAFRIVEPGDLILEINGEKISTVDDVKSALDKAATMGAWQLSFSRRGQVQQVVIR